MQAQALASMGHQMGVVPRPPGGGMPPPHQVPRFMPPNMPGSNSGGNGPQVPYPGMPGGREPSPNNQHGPGGLSRFFSQEVLAQAQSGNGPPLPTQSAMTLEEIERQAAAAVRI
jgi:hypothetical protein